MQNLAFPETKAAMSALLRDLARLAAEAMRARRDSLVEARRLRGELDRQSALIREQAAALAHSRKIIDRSSAQAKIGVWECELPSNVLTWTDGTYDLFDLPRGAAISREAILAFYEPEAAAALKIVRDKAIEERGQFSLDVRIVTAKGRSRWLRITANVETENGRPIRLFGMKQDVTDETALMDRLRTMAERDPLTGLANRTRLDSALQFASQGALLLIDLDRFKQINDTLGHAAGDECLRQVAARLREASPQEAVVARIGGDEFAIVLQGEHAKEEIEAWGHRLLAALARPVVYQGVTLDLRASLGGTLFCGAAKTIAGVAFVEADLALYAAKSAGKGTCRLFTDALRPAPMMHARADDASTETI